MLAKCLKGFGVVLEVFLEEITIVIDHIHNPNSMIYNSGNRMILRHDMIPGFHFVLY